MVFDTEQQRQIILEMLDNLTFPGKIMDTLCGFKQEVIAGEIKKIIAEKDQKVKL